MPQDAEQFGLHVRGLREARGLSIAQAAKRAGFTSSRWHAIETAAVSGTTKQPSPPRVPVVRAIALALDADSGELLELAGYEEDAAWDRARAGRARHTDSILSVDDAIANAEEFTPAEKAALTALLRGLRSERPSET